MKSQRSVRISRLFKYSWRILFINEENTKTMETATSEDEQHQQQKTRHFKYLAQQSLDTMIVILKSIITPIKVKGHTSL